MTQSFAGNSPTTSADALLAAIIPAVERTLALAADRWGPKPTPLLVDGFAVHSGEPVTWLWGGQERVGSDLANQQDLLRTLVGLTALTGQPHWQQQAQAIVAHALEHQVHEPTGLLHWGGHVAWDLRHGEPFGHSKAQRHHELKRHYPFYELMWQINPRRTGRFIQAFWDAHVHNWSNLDFGRHGAYQPSGRSVAIWDDPYSGGPVFFSGKGLSFVNTGSDLFYAAAMLYHFTSDRKPLTWALRLAERYAQTRNPDTGLVGYQFSRIETGDRAQAQLGPEFGPAALEGTVLARGTMMTRYASVGLCQLQLARLLGAAGQPFRDWALADLTALAENAYDPQRNLLIPMLSDGRRITPQDIKRPGYYAPASFASFTPGPLFVRAYAAAYRMTGDDRFWLVARRMLEDIGLDIGSAPSSPSAALADLPADVDLLLALLELWRATQRPDLLAAAQQVGSNLLAAHLHHGLFLPQPNRRYARCSSRLPLALLHLVAALRGDREDSIPCERGSDCYLSCEHEGMLHLADRWERVTDNRVIYEQVV